MSRRATASCLELPPTENEKAAFKLPLNVNKEEEMPDTERAELLSMKSYHLRRELTYIADDPSRGGAPNNEDPKARNIEELASDQLICRKSLFETAFSGFSINMLSKTSLCGRAICRR